MAVFDIFRREIERGDVIMFLNNNANRPIAVINIQEGSLLLPPNQPCIGVMDCLLPMQVPLINNNRTKDLYLQDVVIVIKGVDLPDNSPLKKLQ